MCLIAQCPHCDWKTESDSELEAMIAAAARFDDHLVTTHDYSFGSATEVARKWLRSSLDDLDRTDAP